MGRFAQPPGQRGSLKWIQRYVNIRPDLLDSSIIPRLNGARTIEWRSPLAADRFAEYRDGDFLDRIGLGRLADELRDFWPERGPQWDALARSDFGDVLLIEAKAHIGELCSPGTKAGSASRAKIVVSLASTVSACRAKPEADWTGTFYQLANRLAHLHFLRRNGVAAWLVLVNFIGDDDMAGPKSQAEWEAAYSVVDHVMGIGAKCPLSRFVMHIYPDVADLASR